MEGPSPVISTGTIRIAVALAAMGVSIVSAALSGEPAPEGPVEPTWESLKRCPIPEWVKDAKFGVYTHWGVYSVPAYETNVYGPEMYTPKGVVSKKGRDVRGYHEKTYGPIEKFGYKDFIPLFTAPRFDAAEWVGVMRDAGAKFGGICVVHHDGFCLWDSAFTRWNAMKMGPKRDIYGEIAHEIRKADLKLLATFHHARTYGAYHRFADQFTAEERKQLDIFDPRFRDFYQNPETVTKDEFATEWSSKISEVLRKYQPDMIWFDGLSGQLKNGIISEAKLLETLAGYFNDAAKRGKQVALCNKLPSGKRWNFPPGVGLRSYENGRDMEPDPRGWWLIDRAISYPWTYVRGKKYSLTHQYHISSLVDLVSRGGIFLLSLTPKGDGSIPDEEKRIMAKIGAWLRVNGEGIYGTRPWKVPGEGTPVAKIRQVRKKGKGEHATWNYKLLVENGRDVRFTRKDNTLYAFVLGVPPGRTITVAALARGNVAKGGGGVKAVTMLGSEAKIEWDQTAQGMTLHFPDALPCEVAYGFRITVNGTLDDSPRQALHDGVRRVGDFPVYDTDR